MNDAGREVAALSLQIVIVSWLVACGYFIHDYPLASVAGVLAYVMLLVAGTYRKVNEMRP